MDSKMAAQETPITQIETTQEGEFADIVEPRYTKTYSRFNSPFWQIVVVSIVAFGFVR